MSDCVALVIKITYSDDELVVSRRRTSTGVLCGLEEVGRRWQPVPSDLVSSGQTQLSSVTALPLLQLLGSEGGIEDQTVKGVGGVDGVRRGDEGVVLRITVNTRVLL